MRNSILLSSVFALLLVAPRADASGETHHDDGHAAAGHDQGPTACAAAADCSETEICRKGFCTPKAEKIKNLFGFAKRKQYPPIGWAIVNFVLLIFLLVKFAGKPFKSYLQERHNEARKALDEAKVLREKAQAQLAEIETKIKNLDNEISAIKRNVAEDAEQEKKQIIAAAEAEAERIVKNTDRAMAEELKRVQRELEGEAVDAAMGAAEKLLKQQVNENDHKRLNDEYLVHLSAGGGN